MSDNQPFITSEASESPAVLRQRFQQWGYLLIKQYLPAEQCDLMLADILQATQPYLDFDTHHHHPVLTGEPFSETDPTWDEVYPRIQSLESFHSFFHQPTILDLMRKVVNDEVFVYPMKMARISTPGKLGHETPPHQDAHSHNAGPTMAGIWVALHDVSEEMGRVKVLPKSHLRGVRSIHEALGVGGVQCEIYDNETTWHVSDFEKGDVLIFHSCCVHKAEPNRAAEAARISVDTRFCDHGAPVFSSNLEPHHGWRIDDLDWERIYGDWRNDQYQYYWRDYPNLF